MSANLHNEVIEQVMRMTDDETLLVGFASNASTDRRAVVGRLLAGTGLEQLTPGTPLRAWAYGGDVSERWRELITAPPQCLWVKYQTARALCGDVTAANHYEAWCILLELANQRLA